MQKIYLLEMVQHGIKSYTGCMDARSLVRLSTKAELGAVQEAQRPIDKRRVEDISTFILADGTLSTSVVIGTTDERISVKPVEGYPKLYCMEFPETEKEFAKYENSFDIMDGQHRLFAFLPEFVKIPENVPFDITFEMYLTPTMRERRLIFKNTNEKQKSVASNLLMWFRQKLGMLSGPEEYYHQVVSDLNVESCSPLKGYIIMGAESVTGGFKAMQVIKILDKVDVKNIGGIELDDAKMLNLISQYLLGWEKAVGVKIKDRDKNYESFSKISGLRFMMLLLPAFYDRALSEQQKLTSEFIEKKIRELCANYSMTPGDIFDKESDYIKEMGNNPFTGETPTSLLAKEWSNRIRSMSSAEFDPLA